VRLRTATLAALSLPAVLLACSSPNRGVWEGTFTGSVSGVVEFRINARGTHLTGSMEGATRSEQPFAAEMEGKIRGEHFYATFEGTSRTGALPVRFQGLMRGELGDGRGHGDWSATIKVSGVELRGTWEVEQVTAESQPSP